MTTLYRIDPKANMARFYSISVQPTLFGEWSLMREWGRIGRRSRSLSRTFSNARAAEAAGDKLRAAKQHRSYR